MKRQYQIDVTSADAGQRLDQFLVNHLKNQTWATRSQIQNWIKSGNILVNKKIAKKNGQLLEANDSISLEVPEIQKLDLEAIDLKLEILYEDTELAVIDKAAGISVHPSHTDNNPTLVHGLLFQLKSLSSIGGVERPGMIFG